MRESVCYFRIFLIAHVMSWCMIGHKQPHTCSHTHSSPPAHSPLCFPDIPADLPACTPTDPLSLQLTPPRNHTELLSKDLQLFKKNSLSPPAPQIHAVIEACVWMMIRSLSWREKTCVCNFSPEFFDKHIFPFFSSPLRLSENSIWTQNETLFRHDYIRPNSTKSRCRCYIRRYITSCRPAFLTSQPHHVRWCSKWPLLLCAHNTSELGNT